jgi:dTDP-4-amino-4,6-dideoxygalactose transaminase
VIAELYNREFADVPELALPAYAPYEQRHAWHLYTPLVRVEMLDINRDQFMDELKKRNIGSGLHYKAIHHHPYYRDHLGIAADDLPTASYASERILSLPLFPRMTTDDATDVITVVKEVISAHRRSM